MKLNHGVSTPIEYHPSIEKTVMQVLSDCIGRDNAISRTKLLAIVQSAYPRTSDRQLRACVNKLRKDGQMICSTGGEDGGYWCAASWEELSEYLEREVHSRLVDLAETESALKRAGESRWGWVTMQGRML